MTVLLLAVILGPASSALYAKLRSKPTSASSLLLASALFALAQFTVAGGVLFLLSGQSPLALPPEAWTLRLTLLIIVLMLALALALPLGLLALCDGTLSVLPAGEVYKVSRPLRVLRAVAALLVFGELAALLGLGWLQRSYAVADGVSQFFFHFSGPDIFAALMACLLPAALLTTAPPLIFSVFRRFRYSLSFRLPRRVLTVETSPYRLLHRVFLFAPLLLPAAVLVLTKGAALSFGVARNTLLGVWELRGPAVPVGPTLALAALLYMGCVLVSALRPAVLRPAAPPTVPEEPPARPPQGRFGGRSLVDDEPEEAPKPPPRVRIWPRLLAASAPALAAFVLVRVSSPAPPRIMAVQPDPLTRNTLQRENGALSVLGLNLTGDTVLYLNGAKAPASAGEDGSVLHCTVDSTLADAASLTVQLRGADGRWSNLCTVPILDSGQTAEPDILSAEVVTPDEYTAVLRLEGRNFSADTVVYLDDVPQELAMLAGDGHIEVKLTAADMLLKPSVTVVAQNPGGEELYSLPVTVSIPTVLDTQRRAANDPAFLKAGNLIAHALGALGGVPNTNSLEAFEENHAKGMRLFEVDFQFSADGQLMAMHDRDGLYGTYAEEGAAVPYTTLTVDGLCALMASHPDIFVVTDTKYTELRALHETFEGLQAAAQAAGVQDRLVVQVYNPPMYHYLVNHFEFSSFIYTLYQLPDVNIEDVLDFVADTGIRAVTMRTWRAEDDFVRRLSDRGVFTFTHTVNRAESAQDLLENGIYGVYTDTLTYADIEVNAATFYDGFVAANGYLHDAEMAERNLLDYLDKLENSRYFALLAVNTDAAAETPPAVREKLQNMGVDAALFGTPGPAYVAVLDSGRVTEQSLSPSGEAALAGVLDVWRYRLASGVAEGGSYASILVDGFEQAPSLPGLNLVVLDKYLGLVRDAVNFDTTGALAMRRVPYVAAAPLEEVPAAEEPAG